MSSTYYISENHNSGDCYPATFKAVRVFNDLVYSFTKALSGLSTAKLLCWLFVWQLISLVEMFSDASLCLVQDLDAEEAKIFLENWTDSLSVIVLRKEHGLQRHVD